MIIRMDTRVLMVAEIVLLIISLQSAQGMFREEATKKKSQPQTSANQQAYSSNWDRNQTPRQQSADYSPQASSFTKVEEGDNQAAILSLPGDRGFTNSDRSTFSPKSRRSRVKTYRYPSEVTTRDPTYTTSVSTKTRPQTRRRYRTRKKGGRRVPNQRRLRKRRRRPGRTSRKRLRQSSGDEISELEEYELEDEPNLAASSTQSSSKIPTVPSSRNQGSATANQPSKVVESSTVLRKQSAGPHESTSTRIQQVPSNTGQITTRVSQISEGKSFNTHEEKSKAGNSQQSREIERSWVGGKPSDERVFITKQTSASSSASRDKSIKTGAQEKFVEKKQVEVVQDTSPRSTLARTTTTNRRVSPASRRVQASSTRRKSASAQSSRSQKESSRTVIEKKVGAQRSTAQAPNRSQNQKSLTRQSNRRTTDLASSRDQTGNVFTQKTINQQTSPVRVTEIKNQSPRGAVTDEQKVFSGSPQSQNKQSLDSTSKTVTQTSATRGTADAGSIGGNTPTFTKTEVITHDKQPIVISYDKQPIVISQSPSVITERTGVPSQKSFVREDVVHKGHWDEWEDDEEEEEDEWLEEHDEEEWLEEYDDEEDEEWLEDEDYDDDEGEWTGDGRHTEEWIEEHWEDYYEDEWEEAEIKRRMEEWEREWEERKYQEWKALFMDSVRERKRREWEEKCRVEKWTEIERERRRKGWEDDWDKVEEVRQKAAWGERWKEMVFEERKKIVHEVHEEEDHHHHHHYKPGVRSEIITTTTTSSITKDGTDSGRVNPSEKNPQSPKPAEKTTTETIITRTNTPERSQQGPIGRELDRKDQTKSLDLSGTRNNQITTVKVTDSRQTPSSQGGSSVITEVKAPTSQNERVPDWRSTNRGATITTTSTTTNKSVKDDQLSQSTRNISKQQSSRGARVKPSQQRSQSKNRPGSESRSKQITNTPSKERKRTVTTVTTTKRTSRPQTSSSRTQKADRTNQTQKPVVQKMSTVRQEPATKKNSSPRRTNKESSSQTSRNRKINDPKLSSRGPGSSRTPTSGSPTTKVPGNRPETREPTSSQAPSKGTSGRGQSPNRSEVQRPSIEPMRGPEKRGPGNTPVQKPVPQPMKKDSEKATTPQKSSMQSPQGTSQKQQPTLKDPISQKPTITQMKTTQETLTSPSKETPQRQQPTSKEPTSQKPTITQMKSTQETPNSPSKETTQNQQPTSKEPNSQKPSISQKKTTQQTSTPAPKSTPQTEQPKVKDSTPQKAPIVPMKTTQEPSTPAPKPTPQKEQSQQKDSTPQKAPIVPMKTTQESSTPAPKTTPQKEQLTVKDPAPQKASSSPIDPIKTTKELSIPAPNPTPQKEQPKVGDSTPQKAPIVPMKTTQEPPTPAPKSMPQKEQPKVKDSTPQKAPIVPMKTTQEPSTPDPKSTPQKEHTQQKDSTPQKAPIVPVKTTQESATPSPKSTPQIEQPKVKESIPQKAPIVPMKTTQEPATLAPKSTPQIEQPKVKDSTPQKASPPSIDSMKTTQKPSSPDSKTTPQKEQPAVRDPTPQKNPNVPMQTTKGSSTSSPKETPQQPPSKPGDKTPQLLPITPMKTTQETSTTSKQNQQQHQPTTKETVPKTPSITPTKMKSPENVVGPEKAPSSQLKHDSGPKQPSSRATSTSQRTDTLKSQKPSIVRGKQITESSQSPQTFITKTEAVREPGNDWRQKSVKVVSARSGPGRTEEQDVFLKKNIQNSSISRQKQIVSDGIEASRSSSRSRVTQYSAQKKDISLKNGVSNYSRRSQVSGGIGKAKGVSTLKTSQSSRDTRKRIMHYPSSRSSLRTNDLSFTKSSDVEKDQALKKSFRRGGSRERIRNKQSSQDVGRISSRRQHDGFSSAESQADLFRKLLARDSSSRRSYQDVYSGYSSNYFLDDEYDDDDLYDNLYSSQHTSHPSDSFALKSHSNIQSKWGALRRNDMNYFSPSEYHQYLDYNDEEPDYNDLYSYPIGGAYDYQNQPAYLDKYWSPTFGSRQRNDMNYEWTSPRFSDYELDDELNSKGRYSLRNYPVYSYYNPKSGLRQRSDLRTLTDPFKNGYNFFPFGGKSFFGSPYSHHNSFYNNLWGNNYLFVNGLPRYNILEFHDPNNVENLFFGSIYSPYSDYNPLYNNLWRGKQLFVDYSPTYNVLDNYDPYIQENSISGSIYSPYPNLNPLYNKLYRNNKLFVNGFPRYNILEDYDSNNLENSFSGSIYSPYPFYNELWGDNKLFINGFPSYNILEDYDSKNLENLFSGSTYSPYLHHNPFYNYLWRRNPLFVDDFSKYNVLDYYDPNNLENEGLVDITNGRWGTPWYFAKFSGSKKFPFPFPFYKKLKSGYPSYNPSSSYSKLGLNNILNIHSPSVNPYSAKSRDNYYSLLALISGRNDRAYSQVGRLNDRVNWARANGIFGEGSLYDESIDLNPIQNMGLPYPITRSAFIRGNDGKIINYNSDYFCGKRDPPLAISMLCGNPCFSKCLETC